MLISPARRWREGEVADMVPEMGRLCAHRCERSLGYYVARVYMSRSESETADFNLVIRTVPNTTV